MPLAGAAFLPSGLVSYPSRDSDTADWRTSWASLVSWATSDVRSAGSGVV